MEWKSPPPCPSTITVRRNPPRRARPTPSSVNPTREPISTKISSFPIEDILAVDLHQNPKCPIKNDPLPMISSENLKIYLRVRPHTIQKTNITPKIIAETKNVWPKNSKIKADSKSKVKKTTELCVHVNEDLRSVTVSTPQTLQETKRIKSEVYEGFSRVFSSEASQSDVYEELVKPLVDDFLKGKCGMLAAMGPSGSGKTHTVFGTARQPGMVPLALGRIFSENESSQTHLSRVYYLSMLEINSEKGKGERMKDLLHDGGDLSMQQSVVKGLQEVLICDAQQAESLVARGMLKRATATTNSNNQSSRSQCIINIRSAPKNGDGEDGYTTSTMLTIVDLAGAEREKKTGNQGARLLESNFINNTSMVFSLCLRSLLEHQKNRNNPLQKHYKNSLLTKYMQDYLEGKKRMILILTVKPGIEDYLDSSFLLRQAAPFTKIKFKSIEEPVNSNCNKRFNQPLPRAEQKRMKINHSKTSMIDEGNIEKGLQLTAHGRKEIADTVVEDGPIKNIQEIGDGNLTEIPVLSEILEMEKKLTPTKDHAKYKYKVDKNREYQIMQGLSKALWTVLKQYKENLEGLKVENCHLRDSLTNEKLRSLDLETELTSEKKRLFDLQKEREDLEGLKVENCHLRDSLTNEKSRNFDLETELTNEKKRLFDLQKELKELKPRCISGKSLKYVEENELRAQHASMKASIEVLPIANQAVSSSTSLYQTDSSCISQYQTAKLEEVKAGVSSYYLKELDQRENKQEEPGLLVSLLHLDSETETASDRSSLLTSLECEIVNDSTDCEDFIDDKAKLTHIRKICTDEVEKTVSISAHSPNSLHSSKSPQKDDICFHVEEEQPNCVEHKRNTEFHLKEYEQTENEDKADLLDKRNSEFHLKEYEQTENEDKADLLELEVLTKSNGDDQENTDSGNVDSRSENLSASANDYQHFSCLEDMSLMDSQISSQSTSVSLYSSHNCEQNAAKIVGDEKKLESESKIVSNISSLLSLECESVNDSPDYNNLINVKGKLSQIQKDEEDKIVSASANPINSVYSSKSPQKDDLCYHLEEDQPCNNEHKEQLDQRVTDLPKNGGDAKMKSQFVPILSSASNFQNTQKPKRRLLPASSVLLKDISILDVKYDFEKPKGGRGGKTFGVEEKIRTKGSLSLLHLLKTKVSQ